MVIISEFALCTNLPVTLTGSVRVAKHEPNTQWFEAHSTGMQLFTVESTKPKQWTEQINTLSIIYTYGQPMSRRCENEIFN